MVEGDPQTPYICSERVILMPNDLRRKVVWGPYSGKIELLDYLRSTEVSNLNHLTNTLVWSELSTNKLLGLISRCIILLECR